MKKQIVKSSNQKETFEIGRNFAEGLELGDTVAFFGDLGMGKTEFIKGICDYFRVEDLVTSPTYTIMNRYNGSGRISNHDIPIYHIDLYRIENEDELDEVGFLDCVYENNSIKLVEWAENANNNFPKNKYMVKIMQDSSEPDKRIIEIYSQELISEIV
jgi:tRNA threonylcarbamoyladenosine biosynthesis protein TsaE